MENNQQTFVNILDKETYIDTLSTQFPEEKHLEAAALELLSVFEIDGEDDKENIENCFIRYNLAKTLCNSVHFAAKAEKNKLDKALDDLAIAERAHVGTEITENKLESAINKVQGLESRIQKYRHIYKVLAFEVFSQNTENVIEVLPDYLSQNLTHKHEPWVAKDKYKARQIDLKSTAGKAIAAEVLKKYNRA